MTYIESPPQFPPTFSLAVWAGSISGSALGTDPDPNVTPPSASRILVLTPRRGIVTIMGLGNIRAIAPNGTSITVLAYYYDTAVSLWLQLITTPLAITTNGITTVVSAVGAGMNGASTFLRITANAGGATALGYDYM